jgi:site-specific DNA-methyltransferase (adenine-specific)
MKPYFQTALGELYHGDCLEIMPQLPKVDLVLTDPPYGVNKAEWDGEYISAEKMFFDCAVGAVVNCGEQNVSKCINAMGDNYRGLYYGWNQNGMTRGPLGFMNVIVAVCGGKLKRGMNFCKFTICDRTRKNHPSPKPIEYISSVVQRFSDVSDVILDSFIGSGTTAVACERLNRRWIGIELEEKYCEIAARRIEDEAAQLKLFA